ncbi:MFS transporter [Kitasatospora sp. DSM 101779]|uniref:MFS transporter n=1 Tax=Kitasatospora sp. DSM 101779 TaxID=2853165 RepID=UPI0021DA7646|nr:MFS transporter [Kitasatospora sp. DSM 101779]MCU7826655.1 MFS transporter [Kitasatospora sp. DSM 101779]
MYLADSRRTSTSASAAAPAHGPGRSARIAGTVLALGTVSLITDISSEMVTAVLPLYVVTALGVSPLGFGLLDGVYNGASAAVRLLGGVLGDRGSGRHKAVAAAGYGLSALGKPMLLLARTVPLIGLVLAVDRIGKGLRTAPRDAMISLATPPEQRGRAFGVHRAMDTAGALTGPLLAFLILRAAPGGYHAVFTVSSCVAALGVLVLVLLVPGRLLGRSDPLPTTARLRLPETLRLPGLRRIALCATLLGLATVSDSFVYLLVQRRLDLGAGWFPLLPLGTATAYLLLAVPLGSLGDRIGRRRTFVLGHTALLGGYVLLLLRPGSGLPLAAAVLALHGLFYAASDGMLAAATAETVPEERRGAGLALVGTGQAAGRFACSVVIGAMWSRWGDTTALAVMTGALALAAAAALRLLRPQPDHPVTEEAR